MYITGACILQMHDAIVNHLMYGHRLCVAVGVVQQYRCKCGVNCMCMAIVDKHTCDMLCTHT